MNKIEKGQIYVADTARTGESQKGPWELVTVTDNRGKNMITIFAQNRPSGVQEKGKFTLDEILDVHYGFRTDKNGKWQPQVKVTAVITPVASEYDSGLTGVDAKWEDLSTSGDDPWSEYDLPL